MYGVVTFFDPARDLGMLTSVPPKYTVATFTAANIVGDPAQIRAGETVVFDEARDGHAIIATNVRRA